MYSEALPILQQIQADITAPITALLPTIQIFLDDPVDFLYTDLPAIAIYPIKEEHDDSQDTNSQYYKVLTLCVVFRTISPSIVLSSGRTTNSPASIIATPIVNAINAAIMADRQLGGLAIYVEPGTIYWASNHVSQGIVVGADIEFTVKYWASI
jgi:hypothetical protein